MNKDRDDSSSEHHSSSGLVFQHHHHQNNQISFGNMMQSSSSSTPAIPGSFNISKDAGAYDLGELDQALLLYLDGQDHPSQEHRQNSGMKPPTLNIFPSQPMHVEPSPTASNKQASSSGGLVSSPHTKNSSQPSDPNSTHPSYPRIDVASPSEPAKVVKREGNRRGAASTSEQEGPKTPDPKTLRRLAQNREAARKSRLRKKAYVQQLESSRMRLTQLEQEMQRARSQGFYLGGASDHPVAIGNINSSETALFDMEYARWLEEHHRVTVELRNAMQEEVPENELRAYVDNCLAHHDQMMSLKSMAAKSDVFHLLSGAWRTPAERCFMWMGGFRPSHLIKIMVQQIEPMTEEQVVAMCGVQQTTQEAEEALSQGMEALNHSLSETIVCDSLSIPPNMNTYMSQMAVAINKLSTLEGFLTQADNLRQQTLHRLHQILSTHQAARCFLAMAEYFHRLRALSSLWLGRPRPE